MPTWYGLILIKKQGMTDDVWHMTDDGWQLYHIDIHKSRGSIGPKIWILKQKYESLLVILRQSKTDIQFPFSDKFPNVFWIDENRILIDPL